MKKIFFGKTNEKVSAVALGAMRIGDASDPVKVIETAITHGITFFDHADIYGGGNSEKIFSKAFKKSEHKRSDIFLQSKLGIVPGKMYDFSKEHIINSVEGILERLGTEYLDSLLLHRPDTLMEPEEVAEAFNQLEKEGKVRYFGVSNFTPGQIELLKKSVEQELHANQLQFGLMHTGMIDQGINANRLEKGSIDHDGGVLEFSRLNDMTIQAWSPYQGRADAGAFIGDKNLVELNALLEKLAAKYNTTSTGLAASWILRHPANMQVIAGTMNVERIEQIATASAIKISREDWYSLYMAAGNQLP